MIQGVLKEALYPGIPGDLIPAQVTVGEEGFFKQGSEFQSHDPFGTPSNVKPNWARNVGQDYVSQHSSPNIDFASFHLCVLSRTLCFVHSISSCFLQSLSLDTRVE
jgi:hypothetical protein